MSTLITLVVLAVVFVGFTLLVRRGLAEHRKQKAMSPQEREYHREAARTELAGIQAERRATRGTKMVTKSRKKTHHLFHGLVTIFLPGGMLWAPIWAFQTIAHRFGRREKTVTRVR